MSTQFSQNDRRLVGPALKAFAEIAEAWSLTTCEQLSILGLPTDADRATLDAATVSNLQPQVLERISYLIGIYRALRTIFPNRRQAETWVRRPNAAGPLEGHTALTLMCGGGIDGLSSVREYLNAGGLIDD
ncbi:DUF2384 domain-containing protein [Stenotrophomonas maltophilia]|uniref:MbcA/ParS/Xre antitoxin family protein n=1 Tax=Stenotrophomonas maltophilia TaxID=40324 RepID=UPI0021CA8295|nr:MbcA/ParS/Xre antitoxin family protein [Stenotrophomonas maltophilia]MCU1156857.1 DUF2384 domain-containing protein [Stenotrophomonas maltophilia]